VVEGGFKVKTLEGLWHLCERCW